MKFVLTGDGNSRFNGPMSGTARTLVYFHGMPGSPAELTLFPGTPQRNWFAFDRAQLAPGLCAAQRFDRLATLIRDHAKGGPIGIVAFSLGTYVALEVAHRLPGVTMTLDLISPAAPLQLGAFVEGMAGRSVFSLAANHPHLFRAFVLTQSAAARFAPQRLTSALFATAKGADVTLSADPNFRARIAEALRASLTASARNYIVEVTAYTQDWSPILKTIRHPVTLWQGDADNWTPPAMARALAGTLPNVVVHHSLPGLSHYSTLREALSRRA